MLHESSTDINLQQVKSGLESHLDGLEQRMQLLHSQIEQLQRLAMLGTVSATLAHEFNNILTPIVSYCDYALKNDDPEMMRTAVEKTHKNAHRLTTLCQRILGMAVDDQMGPKDTPILPLITDAVECLGRDLDKDSISLAVNVPEDLTARTTAGALQQVLFNLVINARQAMLDTPGKLSISAARTNGNEVRIDVSDTGVGIKSENQDRIFEPFFSTRRHENKSDRQGIGLGLHICRQLMEQQGGTITVASKPGQGTTFTLTLPS